MRFLLLMMAILCALFFIVRFITRPRRKRAGISKRIVFAGCARNIEGYIADNCRNMYALARELCSMDDFLIVIYHNNSDDKTLQKLLQFQSTDPQHIKIVDEENNGPSRPQRIAVCRNRLLSIAQESGMEFLFMMDMDDKFPNKIFENMGVLENYLQRNDWDALSFNRARHYYDAWAFRSSQFPNNCWAPGEAFGKQVSEIQESTKALLDSNNGSDVLHEVDSAFAGFAVYRLSATTNCEYKGADPTGVEDCEHVSFHADMRRLHKAKIRVAPVSMGD